MNTKAVSFFNVRLSSLNFEEALKSCSDHVQRRLGGYACFVNVHSLVESRKHSALRETLNHATYAFMDGMPLVWLSGWKGSPISTRVCGPDFMTAFIRQQRGTLQGFIGGRPGQAEKISEAAELNSVIYSPPMRPFSPENAQKDWQKFLEKCPGKQAPAIVWVGLGAPKQELWMREVSPLAPSTLFLGVGAAFDFLAGAKTRAPKWMQCTGLEWFYRLAQEPNRLWKRYLVTNFLFLSALPKELLFSREKQH